MPRSHFRAACIAVLASTGCLSGNDPVAEWLACDCNSALQQTVALGDGAVDALTVALRDGPPPQAVANFGLQAADTWHQARRYRDANPGIASLTDSVPYVSARVQALTVDYQTRAALALRGIATPLARQRLHGLLLDVIGGVLQWPPGVRPFVEKLDSDFPVTSVSIRNPAVDIPPGGTVQLTARVRGAGLVPQQVAWVTTNGAIAVVNSAGLVTRTGPGPVTIQACSVVAANVCGATGLGIP